MEILNLYENTQYITQVADWIYGEFIENIRAGITRDDIITSLHKRQKNTLPITYVGVLNNECVGTVSLVGNDLKARPDLTPWLAALYVNADHRGRGYARMLIEKVIETSTELGFHTLYLRTENTAEYYKRLGWKKIYETIDEFKLFTEVFEWDVGSWKLEVGRGDRMGM